MGTIRKNKSEIPPQLSNAKGRKLNSAIFCFNGSFSLTSFVPKKDKLVLMLSTDDISIETEDGKPVSITQYNKEKNGFDGLDKKISIFTCTRSTKKWPHRLFQNNLDISTVNGYCVYLEKFKDKYTEDDANRKAIDRYQYIYNLVLELIEPLVRERSEKFLTNSIKTGLNELKQKIDDLMSSYSGYVPLKDVQNNSSQTLNSISVRNDTIVKRKQCLDCVGKKRETTLRCSKCNLPKCLSHLKTIYICLKCTENADDF